LIGILILNKFIIASANSGKIAEINSILKLDNVRISNLRTMGFTGGIDERGSTFVENALIKAEVVFSKYRMPVIADDSGLSVPYLNGRPGVHSARFAGPDAGDRENNELLLEMLRETSDRERKAWFTCVAVFYFGEGKFCQREGKIEGGISRSPAGGNGFGYDPLFFIPGLGKTMAELSPQEKNAISHRAQAFKALKEAIEDYLRDTA
jgi:XTP/dITP diphosphohydrolase